MINNSFVITALENWDDNQPSYGQSLALELSKHHKVLYVNPPKQINSSNADSEQKNIATQKKDKLWILDTTIKTYIKDNNPKHLTQSLTSKINSLNYAKLINWACYRIRLNNTIIINDNDIIRNIHPINHLNTWLSIYFYHAHLPLKGRSKAQNRMLAESYIKQSDIIITTSEALAAGVRELNFNTFNIGYDIQANKLKNNTREVDVNLNQHINWSKYTQRLLSVIDMFENELRDNYKQSENTTTFS